MTSLREARREKRPRVPFHTTSCSPLQSPRVCLMTVDSLRALANGLAVPQLTVLFGNLTNTFRQTTNAHEVVHEVSKVALQLVYLAAGAGVASFFQVTCWMVTGEWQAARIRNLYLKGILRQEIAFFD